MSRRFAVVHEAPADFHTATELADRVLIDAIDWLDEHLIADQRSWVAQESGGQRLMWKAIPKLAREARIKAHGHFDGKPGEADATAARRAILYLRSVFPDLKAVLLIRDRDKQPERKDGLEQARNEVHRNTNDEAVTIVVGLAVVERESWVISGFEAQDDGESAKLQAEIKRIGFDPCSKSHDLTADKDDTADHSPKRTLSSLSGGNWDRERRCWTETPLDRLKERGGENGLAAYLKEVRERLAPLIGHVAEG